MNATNRLLRTIVALYLTAVLVAAPCARAMSAAEATAQAQAQLPEPPRVLDVTDPAVVYTTLADGVAAWRASLGVDCDQWGNVRGAWYVTASRPDFVPASLVAFLLQFYAGSPDVALAMGPAGVAATTVDLQDDYNHRVGELANTFLTDAAATTGAPASENVPDLAAGTTAAGQGTSPAAAAEPRPGQALTRAQLEERYAIHIKDGNAVWTDDYLAALQTALERLPRDFWGPLTRSYPERGEQKLDIRMISSLGEGNEAGSTTAGSWTVKDGEEYVSVSATSWHLTDAFPPESFDEAAGSFANFAGTIVHELTHRRLACDEEGNYYQDDMDNPLAADWAKRFGWQSDGKGGWAVDRATCVTGYATTNPEEDICESVMMYVMWPAKLKAVNPAKYAWIRNNFHIAERSDDRPAA